MDDKQLKQFLYSCQRKSLHLHFNNTDGIVRYMDVKLEDQTFIDAIYKQKDLLNSFGSGICFSMASWVFDLLYSMGIDNYYLMESQSSYWSNFVILYKTEQGYRICDLAAEVRKNEALIGNLIDVDQDELLKIHKLLKTPSYLSLTPEEYVKEYPIELCKVLDHFGNEENKYYEVPRISLKDFLEQEKANNKGLK